MKISRWLKGAALAWGLSLTLSCALARAEAPTIELVEWLAQNGKLSQLQPILEQNPTLARQALEHLQKEHPSAYLEELDRLTSLNLLARLLHSQEVEKLLRQAGQWIEDDRWGTPDQGYAVVDLMRQLRYRREIELADQLVGEGAYRASLEHIKLAVHNMPFRDRGNASVEGGRRRAAVEFLLDLQGVGEGNVGILIGYLSTAANIPDDPLVAESWLSHNLEMVRPAERAGLPLSASQAYQQLDQIATRLNPPCAPALRFILLSQLFHIEWERDPSVASKARPEFERLAAYLDSQSQLDPYWAARVAQSLVGWRDMVEGDWFDEHLKRWEKQFGLPVFGYARLRGQVACAARLRRNGQAAEADTMLGLVAGQLDGLALELTSWKGCLGTPTECDEVALLAQEFHAEKARALAAGESTKIQALMEYRQALSYAFRARDIADLLNESAPLVRQFEPFHFEAESGRALKESQKLGHRFGMLNAYAEMGLYRADQGKSDEALKNLAAAIELFEKYLVDLRPSPARREALRERLTEVYERYAVLKLQQGQGQEAFQALLRHQQIEQSWSAPVLRSQDSKIQAQLESAQRSKEKMALQQAAAGASPELLAQTKSEFFSVVRELRGAGKNYGGLLAVQPIEFAQLQHQLPEDAVLVQYYPTDKTLYYFVVSRKGFKVRSLAVSKQQLFKQIGAFRRVCKEQGAEACRSQHWDWNRAEGQKMLGLLEGLHHLLIDPVNEDLQGYKVLVVIPTENLLYLPFPALAERRQDKPHFVVEDYAVVTLLRATDLARLDRPASSTGSLLALGNPDGTLEGAQKEVEELAKTFPQADVAVRDEATGARLTQNKHLPEWIHLATHAVLDRRKPNNSYLVVAGQGSQARLTVPQIFDLPLQNTRLVTLSACETDLGEQEPGAAVSSLAEAFWVAGSPSLLASLWAVEDQSTGKLMVDFYRQLSQGRPVGQSLRLAQLGLIGQEATSHPFFWAPFVLIGNWQ